jgi:hypothetical protein
MAVGQPCVTNQKITVMFGRKKEEVVEPIVLADNRTVYENILKIAINPVLKTRSETYLKKLKDNGLTALYEKLRRLAYYEDNGCVLFETEKLFKLIIEKKYTIGGLSSVTTIVPEEVLNSLSKFDKKLLNYTVMWNETLRVYHDTTEDDQPIIGQRSRDYSTPEVDAKYCREPGRFYVVGEKLEFKEIRRADPIIVGYDWWLERWVMPKGCHWDADAKIIMDGGDNFEYVNN